MEMTMFIPLLLMICSFSTAQLQEEPDNKTIPHGKQTESRGGEPANASDHQPAYPQDIHAVLREMSALLAEQRVEMNHLKRDNEAQAAKLEGQTTVVDNLKQEISQLQRDNEAQKATLMTEVDNLKQQLQAKQVAFSASLLASGKGHLGPFNTHTPLVFRRVVTNIGNAYNPNTGFFIAPVRGAYHFEFYIGAHGHNSYPSAAVLVKNGEHIFAAWEHQSNGYGSSANGATLLLEVGDVVFLRLYQNTRIYDDGDHQSTFSGHLLFTM
ncbi:complement C1q-like protein 2 isoform X2 [Scomber japonicus]|uniref:complement C1q-like protein 2 isoform X2 n=1 Tax=Scomber japonicus TaxID=13676 RepID=UPI002305AF15|nr:complement C1q-like protein 2 isoform X2 [Scomber japonicus]